MSPKPWFADIVLDFDWFSNQGGKELGEPRATITLEGCNPDLLLPTRLLLYGTDYQLCHARLIYDPGSKGLVDKSTDKYIHYWTDLFQIAISTTSGASSTPGGVLGDRSLVTLGEGDAASLPVVCQPHALPRPKLDYGGLARIVANWHPKHRLLLHYFKKVVDETQDMEFRWLSAFKLCESFFNPQPGKLFKLLTSRAWQEKLANFSSVLDPALGGSQTRQGLMEEIRALAAHGISHDPASVRKSRRENLIRKTFPVVVQITIDIMNDPSVSEGRVTIEAFERGLVINPPAATED